MYVLRSLALSTGLFTAAWSSAPAALDFAEVDRYLNDCLQENRAPGIAIAILEQNQIIYLKGYGVTDGSSRPVTPRRRFS